MLGDDEHGRELMMLQREEVGMEGTGGVIGAEPVLQHYDPLGRRREEHMEWKQRARRGR